MLYEVTKHFFTPNRSGLIEVIEYRNRLVAVKYGEVVKGIFIYLHNLGSIKLKTHSSLRFIKSSISIHHMPIYKSFETVAGWVKPSSGLQPHLYRIFSLLMVSGVFLSSNTKSA